MLPKHCSKAQYLPVRLTLPIQDFWNVLFELHVTEAPRYAPTASQTWCNIFAWDMALNLGFVLPHWIDNDGNEVTPSKDAIETTANMLNDWLPSHGVDKYNWQLVKGLHEATEIVKASGFAVAISRGNPSGHVAVVRPDSFLAQAGRVRYEKATLSNCFGKTPVRFFAVEKGKSNG